MEGKTVRLQLLKTQLYDAAIEGDIPSLISLLQEDPHILNRCSIEKSGRFMQSPIHVAASFGHLEFIKEILSRKPELAEELDQLKRSSPLHMASAKGHLEVAKTLLTVCPNLCFTSDQDGMNPVHVAAINGHIHVLYELLQVKPLAALERTNRGETVLHLSVKYCQPEALRLVVNVTDDGELLNSKNVDGNTVLHLAVAANQPEVVKFLLENKMMKTNEINKNGSTVMDVFIRSKKDVNYREISQSLKRAKALQAKDALNPQIENYAWLEKQRSALMVVASLIATMAFQVGINPPGGAWQDKDGQPGYSIMNEVNPAQYDRVVAYNTLGLVSSLSVILLLISGLPCKRLFVVILMITMWLAVSATALTYLTSLAFLSSSEMNKESGINTVIRIAIFSWLILMLILLLVHLTRIIVKLTKKLYQRCFRSAGNHPPV